MGLFDFIFGSKKKEQELLRLEEEARRQNLGQERIARERKLFFRNDKRKRIHFFIPDNSSRWKVGCIHYKQSSQRRRFLLSHCL